MSGRLFRSVLLALLAGLAPLGAQQPYQLGPDSERHPDVPRGTVTHHVWRSTGVFAGTIREYWVYVPAQYDGTRDAALMVFQDGHAYVAENGPFRVPIVFDNLIHAGEMPVTIGVFVNPGHHADELPKAGWGGKDNRSVEYDTLSDAYARFLIDELLPEIGKTWRLTSDPEQRAIGGISSGGICAFTVAWERPDAFRKVLSHVGSFTNIRGGHVYPALIRKTKPTKPLRVFLQDGENDLDNEHGNWWLSNQQMAKALAFARYDHRFEGGVGGHDGTHGGAILPESLRWLWRVPAPPAPPMEGVKKRPAPPPNVASHVRLHDRVWSLRSDASGRLELHRGDHAAVGEFRVDGRLCTAMPAGTQTLVVSGVTDGRARIWLVDVTADGLMTARGEMDSPVAEPRHVAIWADAAEPWLFVMDGDSGAIQGAPLVARTPPAVGDWQVAWNLGSKPADYLQLLADPTGAAFAVSADGLPRTVIRRGTGGWAIVPVDRTGSSPGERRGPSAN